MRFRTSPADRLASSFCELRNWPPCSHLVRAQLDSIQQTQTVWVAFQGEYNGQPGLDFCATSRQERDSSLPRCGALERGRNGVELGRASALSLASQWGYFELSGISTVSGATVPTSRMWRIWKLSCRPPLR